MFSNLISKIRAFVRGPRSRRTEATNDEWTANLAGVSDFAGNETPGKLKYTADQLGQNYGAARVDAGRAIGSSAAPNKWLHGAGEVRKSWAEEKAIRRMISPGQRAKAADSRRQGMKELVRVLGQRVMHLMGRLSDAESKSFDATKVFENHRTSYLNMPRSHRGFVESVKVLWFVGGGVVLFDCWVLHGALESSGMSPISVWGTSVTVPLAIAAINHSLGVAAGAIASSLSPKPKRQLAVAIFAAGLTATLVAFVLLTIFRAQAADSQNAAIAALAAGDVSAQLTFFVSPIWMGPLQVAGSFAAITIGALWAIGREGREFKDLVLDPAEEAMRVAVGTVTEINGAIQRTLTELESASLKEFDVEGEKQEALVELEAEERILEVQLAGEEGLTTAVQGEYEATYTYFDQIGKNGGVWRAAQATVFPRFGRPYTPGASDSADAKARNRNPESSKPQAQQNGNRTNGAAPKHTPQF